MISFTKGNNTMKMYRVTVEFVETAAPLSGHVCRRSFETQANSEAEAKRRAWEWLGLDEVEVKSIKVVEEPY